MITTGEAQLLIERIAASNILLRRLAFNPIPDVDRTELNRIYEDNKKALADFAASHPETLGDPGAMLV